MDAVELASDAAQDAERPHHLPTDPAEQLAMASLSLADTTQAEESETPPPPNPATRYAAAASSAEPAPTTSPAAADAASQATQHGSTAGTVTPGQSLDTASAAAVTGAGTVAAAAAVAAPAAAGQPVLSAMGLLRDLLACHARHSSLPGHAQTLYDSLQEDDTIALLEILGEKVGPRRRSDVKPTEQLEAKAKQLTDAGELYKAYPIWCEVAYYALFNLGTDQLQALRAVYHLWHIKFQQGYQVVMYATWLLPRYVRTYGIEHPDTQRLIQQAALVMSELDDHREYPIFIRVVTELVQQLPGGLGWGNAVVAPVPDEEAFNRHVVLEQRSHDASKQGHDALSKTILERCVAFYDTLGPHWLASVRKVHCMCHISQAVMSLEGTAAALPHAIAAKRTAQKELGMHHDATAEATCIYGLMVRSPEKWEATLSLLSKSLRMRQEHLGPYHGYVLANKVTLASAFIMVGRVTEAEALLRDTLEGCVRVHGPDSMRTRDAARSYWHRLHRHKEVKQQVRAMKGRARQLGCDVSGWV